MLIKLGKQLGLLKYARFILAHNSWAYRIWLEVIISRYRSREVLLKHIIEHSRNDSVIYDIGASAGLYSIVLGKLFPESAIYSFEPNPNAYAILLKNIKLTGLKNVFPLNFALSSKNEMSDFHISSEAGRSSLHTYNAGYNSNITGTILVECVTVDYLIKNNICKPPNIIKIDTEGHEYEIIRGASETIAKFHPAIGFEPHGIKDEIASTRDPIENFLVAQGYIITSLGYPIWSQYAA